MAFAFTHQKGVARQVRRIAAEEAQKAVVEAGAGRNFDHTIHSLRRRCKKLRGLLRLIEPDFEDFAAENAAIRDAADLLGGMRDAAVLVETFQALVTQSNGAIAPALADAVHQHLADRVGQVGAMRTREDLLGGFADALDGFAGRAGKWSFSESGPVLLADGLTLTYRRMRKAMAHAHGLDGDAEAVHEWRKHVKYHLHHTKLFGRAAPEVLAPRSKMLDQLGDVLGDHHNLAVLGQTLKADHGAVVADELISVHAAIADRQAALAADGFHLGQQLCVEKPSVLGDRFAGYWRLLPKDDPNGD